jgi:hypothetical protein
MVLLVYPQPDHFWIGRNRGQFVPYRMPLDGQRSRRTLALKIPAGLGPSCVSLMPQLKREWSQLANFGAVARSYY